MKSIASVVIGSVMSAALAAPIAAQTSAAVKPTMDQQRTKPTADQQRTAEQQRARFQISQMERMLEGAVEHGGTIILDRLQAIMPTQRLINENARARGFRLEPYGVFFDVEVPTLQTTFLSSFRSLDQNNLGLESALRDLKRFIDAAGDMNLQQALKRVELQMTPTPTLAMTSTPPAPADARRATGALAVTAAQDPAPVDPVLSDPNETYRTEVKQQIIEAMLDYPLTISADEWLTVGARRHDDRPPFAPADSDASTMIIRIRGGDLASFRAGHLSREEAIKRMDVRVF